MDRDYKKRPQYFLTTEVDIDPLLSLNTGSDQKLDSGKVRLASSHYSVWFIAFTFPLNFMG